MLELRDIQKSYTTNSFTQVALDHVSLAFRDNEFVSILGPSGSGKTTLLNVVGGLDHFDGGDLVIDGISTWDYKDRDWDAYRNNRIGFVFQSYNLIPHQTILSNVELALTLSGVSPGERRERARKALEEVGLGEHVDKRPSQLSGGQMQRVAIARALINDPEILLADEPTGALDSHTSVQVMDLLREVAADRLVIMVTHNPDLAHQYSTRIVELADGRIQSDSDPYTPTEEDLRDAKPPRRTSMSFLTALSLSFNNLMTKKGRTLMTAFAGSIGIIGIAAILALANGVNAYIAEVEEETLSAYPLQILSSGFDMTSLLVDVQAERDYDAQSAEQAAQGSADAGAVREVRMVTNMFGSVGKNDLASLKEYLDGNGGGIDGYVQAIEYAYGIVPQIFLTDTKDGVQQINPDKSFSAFGIGGSSSSLMTSSSRFSTNVFSQLPADLSLVEGQFDIKAGRWPKGRDELLLVLTSSGKVADMMSYAMGLRPHDELEEIVNKLANEEEFEVPSDQRTYTYAELMAPEFSVVPATDLYSYEKKYKVWTSKNDDETYMKKAVENGLKLHIVGIVQARDDADAVTLTQGIYYTPELTYWLMEQSADAKIVQQQLADPQKNVITGKRFDAEAKERRSGFDMSSLFSIDEDKMAQAFVVDTSALDFSGLDLTDAFGTLDFSSLQTAIDPSQLTLPEFDPSTIELPEVDFSDVELDLSGIDFSGADVSKIMTPEVLAILAPSSQSLDVAKVFEGVDMAGAVDASMLGPVMSDLMQGLPAYLVAQGVDLTDQQAVSDATQQYFAQDSVAQQLAAALIGSVSFSDADRATIAANIAEQLVAGQRELTDEQRQTLDKATQEAVEALAQQVGPQVAEQVGEQLSEQLGGGVAEAFGQVLTEALQTYLQSAMGPFMGSLTSSVSEALQEQLGYAMGQGMQQAMETMMANMADAFHVDQDAFAEAFTFNMDEQELSELMLAMMSTERTSMDNNLAKFGYATRDTPSEIDIYANNFDDKARVVDVLDAYNQAARDAGDDDRVVSYTDIVGVLMSSVTDIVNMISYVLIAFVAISLVVSSIMIGVITYISVLERKKEIGILRSIGASKRDVSRVFNAETVIEGLVSGLMGVGITALATIPANIIVEANFDVHRVARLPLDAALVLVCVSVFLSFVAGLIPSRKAATADPVEALRSE